jgi:hypothetical protein
MAPGARLRANATLCPKKSIAALKVDKQRAACCQGKTSAHNRFLLFMAVLLAQKMLLSPRRIAASTVDII